MVLWIRRPARTHDAEDKAFGWKVLLSEIIRRLKVPTQQQVGITKIILTITKHLCPVGLTELDQPIHVVHIKGSVQDSVWTSEFNMKHLKNAEGNIGRKRCEYNNKDEVSSPNILSNNSFLFSNVSNVKLVTLVEGDPKAPFSIAITTRCWGGRCFFPWIAPLYPLPVFLFLSNWSLIFLLSYFPMVSFRIVETSLFSVVFFQGSPPFIILSPFRFSYMSSQVWSSYQTYPPFSLMYSPRVLFNFLTFFHVLNVFRRAWHYWRWCSGVQIWLYIYIYIYAYVSTHE